MCNTLMYENTNKIDLANPDKSKLPQKRPSYSPPSYVAKASKKYPVITEKCDPLPSAKTYEELTRDKNIKIQEPKFLDRPWDI